MSSMFTSLLPYLPFLKALQRQDMPSSQDEDGSNPPADQLDNAGSAAPWEENGGAAASAQSNPASNAVPGTAQMLAPQPSQDTKRDQLMRLPRSGLQGSNPNPVQALAPLMAQDIGPPVMALADGSPYLASVKPTRPIHPVTMSGFGQAINNVIDVHEGGFQNRKDDPGNYTPSGELKGTKYGISAQSYPNEDIKNLTKQRAGELYQQTYGMFSALADQRVMTKALDLAVNMQNGGHGPATEILQKAINDAGGYVPVDGKFGTATADAANAIDPDRLVNAMSNQAAAHYKEIEAKRPDMAAWFDNWDGRAQWQPPQTSSRVSNAGTPWDADSAITNSERFGAIRSIRNALAGLSDQAARPVSAPQKKAGAPQKKGGGN